MPPSRNPISRSIVERAARVICPTHDAADALINEGFSVPVDVIPDISYESGEAAHTENKIAAMHHKIYRRAIDRRRIPALLL